MSITDQELDILRTKAVDAKAFAYCEYEADRIRSCSGNDVFLYNAHISSHKSLLLLLQDLVSWALFTLVASMGYWTAIEDGLSAFI
jgi:hypothetical protein